MNVITILGMLIHIVAKNSWKRLDPNPNMFLHNIVHIYMYVLLLYLYNIRVPCELGGFKCVTWYFNESYRVLLLIHNFWIPHKM